MDRDGAIDGDEPPGLPLFDRFGDLVHDLAYSLTRDNVAAAEMTVDVLVMTAAQPREFGDDVARRTWLYGQTRAEVFARLQSRGRTPSDDRVVEVSPLPDGPTNADLAALAWEGLAAFSERDQAIVNLHARHGLRGQALADTLGVSVGALEVLLPHAMARVETQLMALVLLATGNATRCDELGEVLKTWDGTFSPFVRRRAHDLAERCEGLWAGAVSPVDLLRSMPLVPAPAALRQAVAERVQLASAMDGSARSSDIGVATDATLPPSLLPPGGSQEFVTLSPDSIGPHTVPPPPTGEEVAPLSEPLSLEPSQPGASAEAPVTPSDDIPSTFDSEPLPVPATGPPSSSDEGDTAWWVDRQGLMERLAMPTWLAVCLGVALALAVAGGVFRLAAGAPEPTSAPVVADVAATPVPATDDAVAPTVADSQAVAPSTDILPAEDVAVEDDASSVPPAQPQPAPQSSGSPGQLRVVAERVAIPPGEQATIRVTNEGDRSVQWRTVASPAWLQRDRDSGTIEGGATTEIIVGMLEDLPEGDYNGVVSIGWDGGAASELATTVVGQSERAPEFQSITVGQTVITTNGCTDDRTILAALVGDENLLESVRVTTTGPAADQVVQTTMIPVEGQPGAFQATIGPFDRPGTVAVQLAAVDVRGNTVDGAADPVTVDACGP